MVMIVLQDGLEAYELYMKMNSTFSQGDLVGYSVNLETQESESCSIEREENTLAIIASLGGLQSERFNVESISLFKLFMKNGLIMN
ncbi:MAG: hypothetical protein HXX80_01005 [Nitrososphaerales archaeon]|nr:hypothetical protein [Nitrososphaerales archaeon]